MSNVTVTITGLLKDLDDGLKREQIAEKYGLPMTAVREIFQHPKLKGKQARQPKNYVLVDDTEEIVSENQTQIEFEEPEAKSISEEEKEIEAEIEKVIEDKVPQKDIPEMPEQEEKDNQVITDSLI